MRKRLKIEGGGAYLLNAAGMRVAKITTLTLELLDEDGEPVPAEPLPGSVPPDGIEKVWEHYVAVMEPRNMQLDSQTRTLIREALKVATVDELKDAVNGCKASEFHMGVNDRRKRYNAPSNIFKGKRGIRTTREQIDLFLDIAAKSGLSAQGMSADPARINNAKRDMQTAADMPGDVHVVQRGNEARQWLESQGWTVAMDDDGWPTFTPPRA